MGPLYCLGEFSAPAAGLHVPAAGSFALARVFVAAHLARGELPSDGAIEARRHTV
jgi:hypothetical protein